MACDESREDAPGGAALAVRADVPDHADPRNVLSVNDETLEVIVHVEAPTRTPRTRGRTVSVRPKEPALVLTKIVNVQSDESATAEACPARENQAELG